jgi:hypothetical protein
VRLYSNLHQDLFNKERKQKDDWGMRGGGLTFCKNCNITIRIFGIKNQEKGKNRAPQCLASPPCSTLFLGHAPLKGEGAKMVTRLTNARRPF